MNLLLAFLGFILLNSLKIFPFENIHHFSKGDKIKVDGHMDFVSYTDAEGSKHEYWRILLEDFEFCERKRPKEKKEKDA